MSLLTKYLRIGREANDAAGEAAERVETVTEFLGDVAEKLPDLIEKAEDADHLPDLFNDAIEAAAPWLSAGATAIGEALPPVKAIVSIAKFLTRETDPHALGLLAVSLAYQSALRDAAKDIARDERMRARLAGRKSVRLSRAALGEPEAPEAFAGFRLATALSHPLVRRLDKSLGIVAAAAGYPDEVVRALQGGVHVRFADRFRATISDGRVREKFEPLFQLMELGGKEVATYAFLRRHLDYQLWRFTKAPALGKSGTLTVRIPLERVFTPLDCGVLKWGEIRRESHTGSVHGRRRSPFDEDFGGRKPLLDTVIGLICDREFKEAIIVQGTAGGGKSAFTLQLCQALRDLALRPIRVRMRDLSLDPRISLMEDVAQALTRNCGDEEFDAQMGPCPPAGDIDLSNILDEAVEFGGAPMSPYVLIFDGWDEISISASEGFRIRIEKTLDAIRRHLLTGRSHRVRVLLTGRPSDDVNEAKFLVDETAVLTVRPFTRPQLDSFVESLMRQPELIGTDRTLTPNTLGRVQALKEQFDKDEKDPNRKGQSILGLPLLALLALWLVINDKNPPADLVVERSSLYRRLVDLTTQYGGNVEPIGPSSPRIAGDELRELLQRTAAAMTLRGTEHISYDELVLRLEASGLANPGTAGGKAEVEDKIEKMVLSFFFNTGQREQGCEFIHKSFREYLFAEGVVEALKRNGLVAGADRPRSAYWRDFDDGDPRQALADELGLMLAPQWVQSEVWHHLSWLIAWEVARSAATGDIRQTDEESAPVLLQTWETVRNRLVDLWDWWGEGVHMRPQPYREKGKSSIRYNLPYSLRIAEQIAPPELPLGRFPEPLRLTTLDAHFGDALFRINCTLHFQINKATGWLDRGSLSGSELAQAIWQGAERNVQGGRRYQTGIRQGERTWWVFAPSSPDGINHYLANYAARINAAGWYPALGWFPCEVDFSGVDLHRVPFHLVCTDARFEYACLSESAMDGSILIDCVFTAAFARKSIWNLTTLLFREAGPNLDAVNFENADFENCLIVKGFAKSAIIPTHFRGAIVDDLINNPRRIRANNKQRAS
ncbi:MAG: hypothetical protein JO328_02400 [Hyphomicrobiales bacterium]|nr:hypothetical protein [Hyphomicrobiales bacterium]MBV8824089.1 hypothetical protein [Hyphomicrobiales bacterium]